MRGGEQLSTGLGIAFFPCLQGRYEVGFSEVRMGNAALVLGIPEWVVSLGQHIPAVFHHNGLEPNRTVGQKAHSITEEPPVPDDVRHSHSLQSAPRPN